MIAAIAEKNKKEGKGKEKELDCIILMGGGIGSSYLLYLTKEMFVLRPLVFHVDAVCNSEQAVSNIETIVNRLSVGLYADVINWKVW